MGVSALNARHRAGWNPLWDAIVADPSVKEVLIESAMSFGAETELGRRGLKVERSFTHNRTQHRLILLKKDS